MDFLSNIFAQKKQVVAKNVIFFNNRQEVIHALTSKSKLLEVLLKKKEACPLIFSDNPQIHLRQQLGAGAQGAVFEVSIDGVDRNYVVKKAKFDETDDRTEECSVKGGSVEDFKYRCGNAELVEYIVGTLLSPRYTKFSNFTDIFSLYLCENPEAGMSFDEAMEQEDNSFSMTSFTPPGRKMSKVDTYMFTELLVGGILKKLKDPEYLDSCVLQVLAAIMYYQQPHLMIQHNDLHGGNVMCVDRRMVKDHNGNDIPDTTNFFAYRSISQGTYFVFKAGKYIAKIIDFGFATKYSYPQVINKNPEEFPDFMVPRWAPWYDPIFFMYSAKMVNPTPLIKSLVGRGLNVDQSIALDKLDDEFNDNARPIKISKKTGKIIKNKKYANTFTAENLFYSAVSSVKKLSKNTVLLGEIP